MKASICFAISATVSLLLLGGYNSRFLEHIVYQNNRKNNLIFLHPLYGSAESFFYLARHPDIKSNFNSYLVSLPNFGQSYIDPNFSKNSMARDVKELIECYGLKNVYLVGHSVGAVVAMTVAGKYGNLIKGLLSLGTVPFGPTPQQLDFVLGLTFQVGQVSLNQSLEKIRQDVLKVFPDPAGVELFIEGLEGSGEKYRMTVNFDNYYKNLKYLDSAIVGKPFFGMFKFLTGDQSFYYDESLSSKLSKYYPLFDPRTDLKVVSGGYFAFKTHTDEVIRAILEFLS